jgi:hypothetical protein
LRGGRARPRAALDLDLVATPLALETRARMLSLASKELVIG